MSQVQANLERLMSMACSVEQSPDVLQFVHFKLRVAMRDCAKARFCGADNEDENSRLQHGVLTDRNVKGRSLGLTVCGFEKPLFRLVL